MSNDIAVAATTTTPRKTPKVSTRTISLNVRMGLASFTSCHCQNSITPAVMTPMAAIT
jgi:hypothetical protein